MGREHWIHAFLLSNAVIGALNVLVALQIISIGGGAYEIGIFTTIINLTSVPSLIFWAKLSDYLAKRKAFVLLGLGSLFLVTILYSFSREIGEIYVISALQGFLVSSYIPAASMMIIETRPKRLWDKGIASYQISSSLGSALGLVIGSFVKQFYPFRETYIFLSLFGFISFIIALIFMKEPKITLERLYITTRVSGISLGEIMRMMWSGLVNLPKVSGIIRLIKELRYSLIRGFPLFLIGCLSLFLGIAIFFTPLPALFKDMGLDDSTILALNALPYIVAVSFYNKFAEKSAKSGLDLLIKAVFSRVFIFPSAPLLFLAVKALKLSWVITVFVLCVFYFLIGMTWSAINITTNALVARLSAETHRGSGYGYFNAIIGIAFIIGSYVGGWIAREMGYLASTLTSVTFLLASVTIFRELIEEAY